MTTLRASLSKINSIRFLIHPRLTYSIHSIILKHHSNHKNNYENCNFKKLKCAITPTLFSLLAVYCSEKDKHLTGKKHDE